METFTALKPLVRNPGFAGQRRRTLGQLDPAALDPPLVPLVERFNRLPSCFTMQCCYGHFLVAGRGDPRNLERLPRIEGAALVEYRIAYLALCLADDDRGAALLQDLQDVQRLDPDYVQVGCADWFWRQQVNSYALQVEPVRYQTADTASVPYDEALHLQDVRDEVFLALERLIEAHGGPRT